MKAISIRLDDQLGNEFDAVCSAAGYKKNTILTRLIAAFVRRHKDLVKSKKAKRSDPFEEVIGLMALSETAMTPADIDKVVYDL